MLVAPLDLNDPTLDEETTNAVSREVARAGRVTNMKQVLLRSMPAYALFSDVLPLKASLRRAIGDRAVSVFSHAISEGAGCLLCSTYFRRALLQEGISPESFAPTAEEEDLVELGVIIASPGRAIGEGLQRRLAARYMPETLVEIVSYGAAMLATNVLNTTIGVPLDSDLEPFLAAPVAG